MYIYIKTHGMKLYFDGLTAMFFEKKGVGINFFAKSIIFDVLMLNQTSIQQ
jgi:hypothetical protein